MLLDDSSQIYSFYGESSFFTILYAFLCSMKLPIASNLLDVFGMAPGGTGQMFIPQMSSSCPPEMKDEKMRGGCPFGINPSMQGMPSLSLPHYNTYV